mmetsp:Transcript_43795/g.107779  ORF Transcript_43795/g.107779 Transcript_43795/m.107779 type:complete len:288 (-) Transcript_43795:24-887(-)
MRRLYRRLHCVLRWVITPLHLGQLHQLRRALHPGDALDARVPPALLPGAMIKAVLTQCHQVVPGGPHGGVLRRVLREPLALGLVVHAPVLLPPGAGVVGARVHGVHAGLLPACTGVESPSTAVPDLQVELVARHVAPRVDGLDDQGRVHAGDLHAVAGAQPALGVVRGAVGANSHSHVVPRPLVERSLSRPHAHAAEGPVHTREGHIRPFRRAVRRAEVPRGLPPAHRPAAPAGVEAAPAVPAVAAAGVVRRAGAVARGLAQKQVLPAGELDEHRRAHAGRGRQGGG